MATEEALTFLKTLSQQPYCNEWSDHNSVVYLPAWESGQEVKKLHANCRLRCYSRQSRFVQDDMVRHVHLNHETQLTMQVVNHVRSLIEDGTLKPGDKIPPEREFSKKLKI